MSKPSKPTPLSYANAGVDIDAGNQLVEKIKSMTQKPMPGVLGGIGGFGALFELPTNTYTAPVLVSATDGVGTKLKLAFTLNQHQHIGIDLVAMCANDILVSGAKPLFFLDYFATGALDVEQATTVIASIKRGCELAGAALVGGETAEMPGFYAKGEYDLAGFCVGVVEKSAILDGKAVTPGDVLIALPSSGVHANGFSLIRKLLDLGKIALDEPFEGSTLGDALLAPTRIYVSAITALCEQKLVKAMAHITGGGIIENTTRVLPKDTTAVIDTHSWEWPALFKRLYATELIEQNEMLRTFNCGVGMILCVPPNAVDTCLAQLSQAGEAPWIIGKIETLHSSNERLVLI